MFSSSNSSAIERVQDAFASDLCSSGLPVPESFHPSALTQAIPSLQTTVFTHAVYAQFKALHHKYEHGSSHALSSAERFANTHALFLENMKSAHTVNARLKADCPECIPFLRDWISRRLAVNGIDSIDFATISEYACHGGGASAGIKGCSFPLKEFGTHVTASSTFVHDMWRAIRPRKWGPSQPKLRLCSASGIQVPKRWNINRYVVKEPTCNMYLQLGTSAIYSKALQRIGIFLENQQQKNRYLARKGSMTGEYATVDLKNASDSFTFELMRLVLPADHFEWLRRIRSRFVIIRSPNGIDERYENPIFMTMGNGFTFPLQTLIFCAVVAYCYDRLEIPLRKNGYNNYAVFGDDIIVVTEAYNLLVETLAALGFLTNADKSFVSGPFRESCGGDYYHGFNVRPVHCASLAHDTDVISLINRLICWSNRVGFFIPQTITALRSLLYEKMPIVPPGTDVCSGVWADLHCYSGAAWVPREHTVPAANRINLAPLGEDPSFVGISTLGLEEALLRGDIRNGRLSLRQTVSPSLAWRLRKPDKRIRTLKYDPRGVFTTPSTRLYGLCVVSTWLDEEYGEYSTWSVLNSTYLQ